MICFLIRRFWSGRKTSLPVVCTRRVMCKLGRILRGFVLCFRYSHACISGYFSKYMYALLNMHIVLLALKLDGTCLGELRSRISHLHTKPRPARPIQPTKRNEYPRLPLGARGIRTKWAVDKRCRRWKRFPLFVYSVSKWF